MGCPDVEAMAASGPRGRGGGSHLGGKQTGGPEHYEMAAAPRRPPGRKWLSRTFVERRPAARSGKADALREETSASTLGAAGVWVQARWERFAEITPGRAYFQQGCAATCKDSRHKGETEAVRRYGRYAKICAKIWGQVLQSRIS